LPYRGRFAPSPTGALHLGSLLAALGSYLDARRHGGAWLIRIEDLDTPRVVSGAAGQMLATLARLGLGSDAPILYQSTRISAYLVALERLRESGRLYPCSCSRRDTAAGPYPGSCRDGPRGPGPYALRLRVPIDAVARFADRWQGPQQQPHAQLGDPILRRRDGQIAYQLAVVVDDAAQGITDIVRGADLLPSTAWQVWIREALDLPEPRYAHLPVLMEPDGRKLAKSASSAAIGGWEPAQALLEVLRLMRQDPPAGLAGRPVADILDWAVRNWRPEVLVGLPEIRVPHSQHLGL
jgi:glutamyl-Q tRNA(Asp) synthetase